MGNQQTRIVPARSVPATATLHLLDAILNLGLSDLGNSAEGPPARGRCAVPALPVVSLLFAPGDRSGVEQVRQHAAADPSFLVSFDPESGDVTAAPDGDRWLEVLSNGLTFDLQGLAPGVPQPVPAGTHLYGLPPEFETQGLEAISLRPGPHITSSARMLPVVQALARLAANLAELPGVVAVGWHAARAWSAPGHFRSSVLRWIQGGAFPGLGLTALDPTPEGGLQSEGLVLLTGQELRLAPELTRDRAAGARLALRLLHWLVEHGRLDRPMGLRSPTGEPLVLAPSASKRLVRVTCG